MIHLKTIYDEKYQGFLSCKKINHCSSRLQYLHHVSADHFAFFQTRKNFSIILLYTKDGKAYMLCDGLFWSFPICAFWEEKKLLECVFDTWKNEWYASNQRPFTRVKPITQYAKYLYDHAHLILIIDNTICHKASAHTISGSVYAIECDEWEINNYLQWSSKTSVWGGAAFSSWMFHQIDTQLLQNKFVHVQRDLLQRLYSVFLPQVVLQAQL